MTIVKIEGLDGGDYHPFQSQSHRDSCWEEGYIAVPESLEATLFASGGHCKLGVQGEKLISIEATTPPTISVAPTEEEDRDAMLLDVEFRLVLLELGVM